MEPKRPCPRPKPGAQPRTVLILTADVGGGHRAAGRAVGAALVATGSRVVIRDGLRPLSPPLERLLVRGYAVGARHLPGAVGLVFRLTATRPIAALARRLVGRLLAHRLLPTIDRVAPALIVSTYPLVTAALGSLRARGRVGVPVAAVIPDYGVHPLWIAHGVDLHLVPSRASLTLAARAGGRVLAARLPVGVRPRTSAGRAAARAALGVPADAFVALIVGGAGGIGDLQAAARCARMADVHAVVVTGTNAALRRRLERRFAGDTRLRVLGWAADMPGLLAAADCLIQNAGGMTCLEALALGVPVLLFRPIPGHGSLNARVMARAGVARWARSDRELRALLGAAARRDPADPAPQREPDLPSGIALLVALAGFRPAGPPGGPGRRGPAAPAESA